MHIGTSGLWGKGHETVPFGGQEVKAQGHIRLNKVTEIHFCKTSQEACPIKLCNSKCDKQTKNTALFAYIGM